MSRVFLIDTDTASDDAVALIMAIHAPDVRVAAITTVAGNVDVDQATRNALYTVELCGSDIPVYSGAEKPLLRAHQNARWFHGNDGLGSNPFFHVFNKMRSDWQEIRVAASRAPALNSCQDEESPRSQIEEEHEARPSSTRRCRRP